MINNTWKPWIKLVETKDAKKIINSVPKKYRELVALVLSAAKWHPSRREAVKRKETKSIHKGLEDDSILCDLCMTVLGTDCSECPLFDKKKQVDCAGVRSYFGKSKFCILRETVVPSKPIVQYFDTDFLEDKDKYANLFYKEIVKAYKKELKKFPELTKAD